MSECRDEVSCKVPDSAALTWLTAGQLAAAVINYAAPNLFVGKIYCICSNTGGNMCSALLFCVKRSPTLSV